MLGECRLFQAFRNDPLLSQQAQVAVSHAFQIFPSLAQVVGGTAVGDKQGDHLAQGKCLGW